MWKLNNTILGNQRVREENKTQIKNYLGTNNRKKTCQNLWKTTKAVQEASL